MLLSACASRQGIEATARPLAPARAGLDPAATGPALAPDWWRSLGDPALNELIERALREQPSLRVAQARVARAEAAVAAEQADTGPQTSATGDLTGQRYTANGAVPPPLAGSVRSAGTLQLQGGWEFDFFGRHRAAIEAATGGVRAAQAELAAARAVLASGLARGWVQLGRLQEQRAILQQTLRQRESLRALTQQRVQAGLDTALALRLAEGALPEARQQIEQVDEQIMLTRQALAALSAQPPQALAALNATADARARLPLPTAVPADLLGRRPDVAAARWRIEAASGEVRSTHALFYPNVNLRAFAGLSSIGLDRLLRAGSEQAGVGAALHLPIFEAGGLRAKLRARTADLDAAVESYNAAVIEAVREVADLLGSLDAGARQQEQQAQAQAAAEAAHALAEQRYRAGLGNRLVVLASEGGVLQQQRQAADLRARQLDIQIALIKALGGGQPADAGP